jgi:hypothetical protein
MRVVVMVQMVMMTMMMMMMTLGELAAGRPLRWIPTLIWMEHLGAMQINQGQYKTVGHTTTS